jgi:hypothetical protein
MQGQTRRYEKKVQKLLRDYFKSLGESLEVESQWTALRGEAVSKYSPRVDVAVGPFAYQEKRYAQEYNRLTAVSREFLNKLLDLFKKNSKNFSFDHEIPADCQRLGDMNRNARCLMPIEIEKSGDRKHRLGDIVNACSLGRVGLIIAWDQSALNSFLKIVGYFAFLKGVEKPTYETENLIVVSKKQFDACIKGLSARSRQNR